MRSVPRVVALLCCCSASFTDGAQTGNCQHADSSAVLKGATADTGSLSGYKAPLTGPAPPPAPPRLPRPPPAPPAYGTWGNAVEAPFLPHLGAQLQVRAGISLAGPAGSLDLLAKASEGPPVTSPPPAAGVVPGLNRTQLQRHGLHQLQAQRRLRHQASQSCCLAKASMLPCEHGWPLLMHAALLAHR